MTAAPHVAPVSIPDALRATLVLVRHGESTFVAEGRFQGRLDPPLSARGERQVARTAAWLAGPSGPPGLDLADAPIEIVHSPLARTARSAQEIAAAFSRRPDLDQPPVLRPEPGLVELSQGRWEGLTHAEVTAGWGDVLAAWLRNPTTAWAPDGEPLVEADRRVRAVLPGLLTGLGPPLAADPGEPGGRHPAWSVVVAHDGILRLLLMALLQVPVERFWAFPFALGAASVVDLVNGRASLRAHNLAGHLVEADDSGVSGGAIPDRGGAL